MWRDPETINDTPAAQRHWFAEIVDYRPFPTAVPAKIEGEYLEQITQNFWGVGVRALPSSTYRRILALAGLHNDEPEPFLTPSTVAEPKSYPKQKNCWCPECGRSGSASQATTADQHKRKSSAITRSESSLGC